ncbi:MAG: TIM-barrel domain-containing protein, partial [Chloroflexota bacterium]
TIVTDHLRLQYDTGEGHFTPETLSISLRDRRQMWRYGDLDEQNLKGTLRTLDLVSGAATLDPGLLSRGGWVVVDDSRSLVFDEQGWLANRSSNQLALDLYFFGYGNDYQTCLQDYFKIAGAVPLLPRWALGNWWSRFWEYTQDELQTLMSDFRRREVPLSVCIIDMDWHLTDTGNESSGWTGYTWNRDLVPDPQGLLDWLHKQGLRTALNLHPAEGIHPHEEDYDAMARAMGVDPDSKKPIPFDIADPRFAHAYFEILHHPKEEEGVDFWWMDWQQGTLTSMPGLDPLWWLNHLHFYDHAREQDERPLIFSRWGGLGNHRYPVGFSGDTVVDWPSLAFQPYQTATAANVGFGWWSHDIGGHMQGIEESELYARWVQFGVFSPIMRLHSTKNPYHERRPWAHDAETFRVTRDAMQLRHSLIPYLYAMAWRNHQEGISPIRPMYHDFPEHEEAYHCHDQYTFGSELIAAPFLRPADKDTHHSRQVMWLPPGDWFHFFDGRHFAGDRWQALYGTLDEIPVLARAGAIVPLAPHAGWGSVENPKALDVVVFPGADNVFELYEDDGESLAYQDGAYALTRFRQEWQEDRLRFEIAPVEGDRSHLPDLRTYRLVFRGVSAGAGVQVHVNGESRPVEKTFDEEMNTLRIAPLTMAADEQLVVILSAARGQLMPRTDHRLATLERMITAFRLQTSAKMGIVERLPQILARPKTLADYAVELKEGHWQALLETILDAGLDHNDHSGEERLVLWNNNDDERVTYRLAREYRHRWMPDDRFEAEQGAVPHFKVILPAKELPDADWRLTVQYGPAMWTATHKSGDQS